MVRKLSTIILVDVYLVWAFLGCSSYYPLAESGTRLGARLDPNHSIVVVMKNGREYELKRGRFFEVPLEGVLLIGANGKQLNARGFEIGDRFHGVIYKEDVDTVEREGDDVLVTLASGTRYLFSSDLVHFSPDTASPGIVGIVEKQQHALYPGELGRARVFGLVILGHNKIDHILVEKTDPTKTLLFVAAVVLASGAATYAIARIGQSEDMGEDVPPEGQQ